MTTGTMSHGDPSFSERESALILQRAAELQAQQGRGLSLPELESAAAEAGIDVALVRQAAAEVTTLGTPAPAPAPASGGGMLGAPLRLLHERVVDGELDPSRESDVMAEITWQLRHTQSREPRRGAQAWTRTGASAPADSSAPSPGEPAVGSSGRRLTWANPDGRKIKVALVPRSGRTVIRVEEQVSDLAGGLFLGMGLPLTFAGLGFILPICLAVLHMPVLIPVAFIAWATMVLGVTRVLFTTLARQRDASLRALADGLAEVCQNAPPRLPPG
ncbi:MAG: hypothetical protein AAGF11_13515 [Myxococcota bacterium]